MCIREMEELTSSKDISALERSAMTERYAPGRSGGIQLSGKGSNWTYGIGYFEADGDGSDDFNNTAVTARGTFAPIQTNNMVAHLGAGYTTRGADVQADEVDTFNLELAGASGPFHARARRLYTSDAADEEVRAATGGTRLFSHM